MPIPRNDDKKTTNKYLFCYECFWFVEKIVKCLGYKVLEFEFINNFFVFVY